MSSFHFSPRPNRANEIHWHEWGDAAFALARAEDKPILLGISAVWCHWCHVMDETSYSDPTVIGLINERFVPIRVDNDQRPDVNRRYNLGGWPTTAFLTPEGELLTGGTYLPPEQMRPLLAQVSGVYQQSKSDLEHKIAQVKAEREHRPPQSEGQLSPQIVDTVLREVMDNFDPVHGGFGDEPKFPHPDALDLSLERYFRSGYAAWQRVVMVTLTNMTNGGTYDQVAGGFFRYSTNRDWSIPHYEKMLEDNAKLLALLARTHPAMHNEDLGKVIHSLTSYINSTLSDSARGGFFGSQDADENYYSLPLEERSRLPAPYVDRTLYTDWNALMVTAFFAVATLALPRVPEAENEAGHSSREVQFAIKTLDRLWNDAYRPGIGLHHFIRDGEGPQLPGQLSDLARASQAFLDAYQTTGEPVHLERAQALADEALTALYDGDAGAFWSESSGRETLGLLRLPDKSLNENAAMAEALTRLYRLTGDQRFRAAAEKTLAFFANDYVRYGFMAAEYALAVDHFLNEPVVVHIVGTAGNPATRALHRAALQAYTPGKIVQLIDPMRDAARLAQLGYPADNPSLAYICVGTKCLAPIGDAAEIEEAVKQVL
ncbi:MAG: DUF255 domain-containing protein [Chloroflexi bacterium]|nr:DUF255 domain-containing protein [Chloroflexota bacterium]